MKTTLSKEAIERMNGLVNIVPILDAKRHIQNSIADIMADGFEPDEAREFIKMRLADVLDL